MRNQRPENGSSRLCVRRIRKVLRAGMHDESTQESTQLACAQDLNYLSWMILFVLVRDIVIFVAGVYFFEFHLDFTLPDENNLLLFFVAIPIVWATMMQMWTAISYREQKNRVMYWACHLMGVILLICSVFLISAVLNTIESSLDTTGNILFHGVGWSAIMGIIFYDVVDIARAEGDQ